MEINVKLQDKKVYLGIIVIVMIVFTIIACSLKESKNGAIKKVQRACFFEELFNQKIPVKDVADYVLTSPRWEAVTLDGETYVILSGRMENFEGLDEAERITYSLIGLDVSDLQFYFRVTEDEVWLEAEGVTHPVEGYSEAETSAFLSLMYRIYYVNHQ